MKKVLALILAILMVASLAACGGKPSGKNLQTAEMTVEASGLEELTKVTVGAPKGMEMVQTDWSVQFTDEKQDAYVEAYLCCDYNCYNENKEYAKEEYDGYKEQKFGDYDGYYYISDSGDYVEVFVYLGCVAEIDDVYLSYSVSSVSNDTDPMDIFKLKDVQTILNYAVFTPAQESAETT